MAITLKDLAKETGWTPSTLRTRAKKLRLGQLRIDRKTGKTYRFFNDVHEVAMRLVIAQGPLPAGRHRKQVEKPVEAVETALEAEKAVG